MFNGQNVEIFNVSNENNHLNGITHIFFENGSQVNEIGSYAFYRWNELRYVKMPNNNMTIGHWAFCETQNMFNNVT
jgi:hypothetical protein